jgi:hypothetical protein
MTDHRLDKTRSTRTHKTRAANPTPTTQPHHAR